MGTDGCSIPSYAVPLTALARGFARIGTGQGSGRSVPRPRPASARPVAAHPFMVAGTGRFDTRVMGLFGERIFIKTGAEGVYCGAIPELGYGIALKCDDGAGRASEMVMAALIARFLPMSGMEAGRIHADARDAAEELERHRGRPLVQARRNFHRPT